MPSPNQVGIITGGAAGIGKACAIRFAKEGMRLVLGNISASDGAETLRDLKATGADAAFECGTIADESFCQRLVGGRARYRQDSAIEFNRAS